MAQVRRQTRASTKAFNPKRGTDPENFCRPSPRNEVGNRRRNCWLCNTRPHRQIGHDSIPEDRISKGLFLSNLSSRSELLPVWLSYLCLALSMSLVGSYVALSKPLVLAMPVFLLAWLRFGIGALAMPGWLRKPVGEAPMSPRTKGLLFLESFLGNFMFTICMLYGVSKTTAISAGVILASLPGVVAILSWIFLRERIEKRVAFSIALAVAGIAWFSVSKTSQATLRPEELATPLTASSIWLGNALVFAAVVCEASYAVIGKSLTINLSPKRITAIINLWGLALMTPLGVYAAWYFDFSTITIGIWGLLLFYALAASVGTVWLWMTGLKGVPASKAGVFTVMLPLTTALVGVLWLDERMNSDQIMAFGLALTSVVLATLPSASHRQAK